MMKALSFIYMVFLLPLAGCNKVKPLPPREYVLWVENPENGLRVSKQVDGMMFTLQYQPHDYLALKTSKKLEPTREEIEIGRCKIEDLQYFTFQVGNTEENKDALSTGISDNSEFYGRIQYFTSAIQQDFKLVDGSDTLPCVLHHFERTYDLTPYTSFVIGFENRKKNEATDKLFIYEDKILQAGTIKILIPASSLSNIPQLIIQ